MLDVRPVQPGLRDADGAVEYKVEIRLMMSPSSETRGASSSSSSSAVNEAGGAAPSEQDNVIQVWVSAADLERHCSEKASPSSCHP